jgi:plastocyanin
MIYNVFDKEAVRSRRDQIQLLLNLPLTDPTGKPLPGFAMPQGRVLEERERAEILRLVEKLFVGPKHLTFKGDRVDLIMVGTNYVFTAPQGQNPTFTVTQGATVKVSLTSGGGSHDWVLAHGTTGNVIARTERVAGATPVTVEFVATDVGNHVYYCSVGQHRALGMEGRLIIESR